MRDLREGFDLRKAADPSFLTKSIAEVILSASTQLTAELKRRGADRMLPEIDFVIAGVATAVFGKYVSAWRTAPTLQKSTVKAAVVAPPRFRTLEIPTNAFQPFLLDGVTRPTLNQRVASLIAPCVPLFRAGATASLVGYGLTALMVQVRSYVLPTYVAATRSVNIVYACLYTGTFMAVVSNLRYQLLQGLIEPAMDRVLGRFPVLQSAAIIAVRIANGLLGSMMAIAGMQSLGLQRVK